MERKPNIKKKDVQDEIRKPRQYSSVEIAWITYPSTTSYPTGVPAI